MSFLICWKALLVEKNIYRILYSKIRKLDCGFTVFVGDIFHYLVSSFVTTFA